MIMLHHNRFFFACAFGASTYILTVYKTAIHYKHSTVCMFSRVYNGFHYIGFQGTENAADEDSRREIAVEKATGGSYVVSYHFINMSF